MKRIFCSGVAAATFSAVLFSRRYIKASPFWGVSCSPMLVRTNHSQFIEWTNHWFKNVKKPSPVFICSGEKIKILTHPEEFYTTLKVL